MQGIAAKWIYCNSMMPLRPKSVVSPFKAKCLFHIEFLAGDDLTRFNLINSLNLK